MCFDGSSSVIRYVRLVAVIKSHLQMIKRAVWRCYQCQSAFSWRSKRSHCIQMTGTAILRRNKFLEIKVGNHFKFSNNLSWRRRPIFNRLWPDSTFKASHCSVSQQQHQKPFFIHLLSLVLWSWQSQRNCVFSFECKQTPFCWWKCATRHSFSFLFSLWSIALSILLIINALSCAVYKLLMNERPKHVEWAQQMQRRNGIGEDISVRVWITFYWLLRHGFVMLIARVPFRKLSKMDHRGNKRVFNGGRATWIFISRLPRILWLTC